MVELMIVAVIISIIAGIGIPSMRAAQLTARNRKAITELQRISADIHAFSVENHWALPPSLEEVGHGGRLDPWGKPYQYSPVSRFVPEIAGLIADPVDLAETPVEKKKRKKKRWKRWKKHLRKKKGLPPLPEEVDPAPEPEPKQIAVAVELNVDYDLFSFGVDGRSATSINAIESLDDPMRARSGDYFGLAGRFQNK